MLASSRVQYLVVVMKLSNRIFLSIFWIIIISVLGSALVGAVLISRAVRSEAFERVNSDLKVARLYLNRWIQDLSIESQARADGLEKSFRTVRLPDLSVLVSRERNPALYRRFTEQIGRSPDIPQAGFVSLPAGLVRDLGAEVEDLEGRVLCDDEQTMWLFATDTGGLGTAFSGILLNGNLELVSDLQELLFGRRLYEGKPFGTVTVFCGDKRVATTVIGPQGKIAVGTRVSEVVREKVLVQGDRWLDRAFVVDDWYLSAYEPIRNPDQSIIGILYVGVLEKYFLDIRNRALLLLSSIVVPALFLFVGGVYLISRSIVRPVAALARASERIASGELEARVELTARSAELKSLASSFNQMAEAVRKRERMLTEKNDQLAAANRDYQELLSFVTHELNNSVGSLLLNVSLLIDPSTGDMDQEKKEIADQVLRDVERFRDMVRNYLNISRLEKGTLRYHPELIDPRESVAVPVLNRLRPRIEHRNMEVRWEWECREPVPADQELLDICYSNLLVNALKYGEEWVSLSCRAERDGVVLGVRNGGPPIPKDKIDLLFRKFSRLVKSDDGAGLGLYLVRQIIEQHGGTVWCESSPARGTGFYMKLPFAG